MYDPLVLLVSNNAYRSFTLNLKPLDQIIKLVYKAGGTGVQGCINRLRKRSQFKKRSQFLNSDCMYHGDRNWILGTMPVDSQVTVVHVRTRTTDIQ